MNFSKKMKLIRTQRGYSQEQLADLLNVTRQTVSKWESEISLPEIDKLIEISELFQVSIDYLLKDTCVTVKTDVGLERMVLQFLGSSQEMSQISQQLITIMQDGVIDDSEKIQMEHIIQILDRVSENIERMKKALNQ